MLGGDGHWLPGLDPATGAFALPLWLAGALAALFVAIGILAFNRRDMGGSGTPLLRYAVILLGLAMAWNFFDQSAQRERDTERRAFDARAAALTARSIAPGSALACIDAGAGDVVEAACERNLFGSPEAVAAAVAYAGARLTLLADGVAHLDGTAVDGPAQRRSIEVDRYGLMAHVLATRDGCTAETCDAFAWLSDSSHIRTNLEHHAFDIFVAQNAGRWSDRAAGAMAAVGGPSVAGAAAAAAPNGAVAEAAGAPVPSKYDFPSADSIPPISIMNAEPAATNASGSASAPAAAAATPVPAPRKPPMARHTASQGGVSAPVGAPMALPSAADAAAPPRVQ
jgi:hypothetical protein